jgi:ketosteroid isomerase-like protein
MSANLDLVRSIYAAWERGDWTSAEWAHPEIEYVLLDGPAPFSRKGLAGLADGWREFLNAWDDFRVENVEHRELDSERVLMLDLLSGRGATSGLELGQMQAKGASLFHIHDGKVARIVTYWDREHAFADLGLALEAGAMDAPG